MEWQRIVWTLVLLTTAHALAAEPPGAHTSSRPTDDIARAAMASDAWREYERVEAADAKLRAALAQHHGFNWNETPLGEVAKELAEVLGAPVRLDRRALEDAGLDADTPLTATMHPMPIRKAVHRALEIIDLASYVDEGTLVITTKEKSDERLIVRVHDVTDLVVKDLDDPLAGTNYQSLFEVIHSVIAPETWDVVGGQAALRPFSGPGIEAVVVSQTEPIHDEIEVLLIKLRRARREGHHKTRPLDVSQPLSDSGGGIPMSPPAPFGPLPENADRDSMSQAQATLACTLFSKFTADPKRDARENIVFSPFGIATALALASAGARGETAGELLKTLGTDLSPERLHAAMSAQAKELPIGAYEGVDLRIANRLWVQSGGGEIAEDFNGTIRRCYGADVGVIDFGSSDAHLVINDWISKQTNGRDRGFIGPGVFNEWTRLVLVNAVSFRGTWHWPFRPGDTELRRFRAPSADIDTPTMFGKKMTATYTKMDGLEILGKAYGGSVEMTILLPAAEVSYAEFEKTVTPENLRRWLAPARRRDVDIFLPKFKIKVDKDLAPVLASMGVKRAFSQDDADFSGIVTDQKLFLQQCQHAAEIELDEQGTVAVAVTRLVGGMGGLPEPVEIPTFRADRPFVFLIRDTRTDTILFMGRVMNPAQ